MPWLQLRIDSSRELAERLEDALLEAGAASVTLQDNADEPILEPALGETPLWHNTRITGLFDAETDTALATTIATASYGNSLPNYRWELLEDKDWERSWMDNFKPICCGTRLWICPSWQQPPEPEAVNLMLDPGLAFGSGTHPTTFLCMQWLDRAELQGKTLIDYGCGSGILGIAALLLGASKVIGVDTDPQALAATRDNAKRNGIDPQRIETYFPEQLPAPSEADIIVANILAGPLHELAPKLSQLTRPQGQIVLSGILVNQADALAERYRQWFDMARAQNLEEWARLDGRKK